MMLCTVRFNGQSHLYNINKVVSNLDVVGFDLIAGLLFKTNHEINFLIS